MPDVNVRYRGQSYLRVAKRAAMMAGRYAHAKQFSPSHRQRSPFGPRRLARSIDQLFKPIKNITRGE
jgi:IS5 family transposase